MAGVAIGGGSVWVTDAASGELLRFDQGSGRLRERIEVGGKPGAVAYGGNRVWVADENGAGVTAVNAQGGKVFRARIGPARGTAATGGRRRRSLGLQCQRRHRQPDRPRQRQPSAPIQAGRGPAGITVARGFVWVADSRSGTVAKIDPAIRSVVDTIEVGGNPGGIDAGSDILWVASAADDEVTRINLGSGETEGSPIAVGPEPGAIGVGLDSVWVANNGDGTVTRIEP